MTRAGRIAFTFTAGAGLLVSANALRYTLMGSPARTVGPPGSAAPSRLRGSVYDLGLRVRDADGVERGLDGLRGHPVLASMFYASCTTACPLLVSNMKRMAAAAPPEVRADLRLLLVSFDPARDTPAVLVDVSRRHDLDVARWRIAVAPDEATARALAAVFGTRFRTAAGGTFDHTTAVTVLDRRGEVLGGSDDPSAVSALLAGATDPDPMATK